MTNKIKIYKLLMTTELFKLINNLIKIQREALEEDHVHREINTEEVIRHLQIRLKINNKNLIFSIIMKMKMSMKKLLQV
jgi:hypothetical protein